MACNEHWEKIIQDYFDGDLPESRAGELMAHVEACPDCASFLADMEEVAGALAGVAEGPPVDVAALVLAKTAEGGSFAEGGSHATGKAQRRTALRRVLVFAAAAAVLVLALLGLSLNGPLRQAPASAAEVVNMMNQTLGQLDELEVKADISYFNGKKTFRQTIHEVLQKPNLQFYDYRSLDAPAYRVQEVTDGHTSYMEFTQNAKTTRSFTRDKLGIIKPKIIDYARVGETTEEYQNKIHKELAETNLNGRPVYRVVIDTVGTNKDPRENNLLVGGNLPESERPPYFKARQTIWVDRETMLPLRSEWVRDGDRRPYRVIDFKVFKTSGVNEVLLKVPKPLKGKEVNNEVSWKEARREDLAKKAPQLLPPEKIGDWKVSYYASDGKGTAAEYRKGNNMVVLILYPPPPPEMVMENNISSDSRTIDGVSYQYAREDFWSSSLSWGESNRGYTLEGTIPIKELHLLASKLRNPGELKQQTDKEAARKGLLNEMRARAEDFGREGKGETLTSYKLDYLLEYTPLGGRPRSYRIIDIYRAPFERHMEIYKGEKAEGLYDLLVKNLASRLWIIKDPNAKMLAGSKGGMAEIENPGVLDGYFYNSFEQEITCLDSFQLPQPSEGTKVARKGTGLMLGREAVLFEVKGVDSQGQYWVDKATGLSLKIEMERQDKSRIVINALDFTVNSEINDRLFEVQEKYPGEDVMVDGSIGQDIVEPLVYSPVKLEEVRRKAGFKIFIPENMPPGGCLAQVLAARNEDGHLEPVNLIYQFPEGRAVIIREVKAGTPRDWQSIKTEILGGSRFFFADSNWVDYFSGEKGSTDIEVTSNMDANMVRQIISSLN